MTQALTTEISLGFSAVIVMVEQILIFSFIVH